MHSISQDGLLLFFSLSALKPNPGIGCGEWCMQGGAEQGNVFVCFFCLSNHVKMRVKEKVKVKVQVEVCRPILESTGAKPS